MGDQTVTASIRMSQYDKGQEQKIFPSRHVIILAGPGVSNICKSLSDVSIFRTTSVWYKRQYERRSVKRNQVPTLEDCIGEFLISMSVHRSASTKVGSFYAFAPCSASYSAFQVLYESLARALDLADVTLMPLSQRYFEPFPRYVRRC